MSVEHPKSPAPQTPSPPKTQPETPSPPKTQPETPSRPKAQPETPTKTPLNRGAVNFRAPPQSNVVPVPVPAPGPLPNTPGKHSTHSTVLQNIKIEQMRDVLKEELEGAIFEHPGAYHKTLFGSSEFDDDINKFFMSTDIYSKADKRWCGLPLVAKDEKELYSPFSKIFSTIETFFLKKCDRTIVDTHKTKIPHRDGKNTSPDFMVMGGGPNFLLVNDDEDIVANPTYRCCVSVIEIKTASNSTLRAMAHTLQVASYARQCFLEQQNRKFVYALLVTETNARVFIFDRSGGICSEPFNIHDHPEDFVRLILGISSRDDEKIGLDTSIYWVKRAKPKQNVVREGWINEPDDWDDDEHQTSLQEAEPAPPNPSAQQDDKNADSGTPLTRAQIEAMKKTARRAKKRQNNEQILIDERYRQFIRVKNFWDKCSFVEKIYRVKHVLFLRDSLCGRGTKCWIVYDPDDKDMRRTFIIKESWRPSQKASEVDLLKKVLGLAGVGQMIAYQEDPADCTARFRKLRQLDPSSPLAKSNRTFTRIVLEEYGKGLQNFEDPLHLLYAFRDAVKGHRSLWERGILHRDVSVNNILFGKEGASDGDKGVLIDLDMAIEVDRDYALEGFFRTGTRAFQSINILTSCRFGKYAAPQDHLDDLESYFYCLGMICCCYTSPGVLKPVTLGLITKWEDGDLDNAVNAKAQFLRDPALYLTRYFACFSPMFRSMGNFLLAHSDEKQHASHDAVNAEEEGASTAQNLDPQTAELKRKARLERLKEESKGHYDTFIGFIDEAIESLFPPTELNPQAGPGPFLPPVEITTAVPLGASRKRGPDGVDVDDDFDPPQKKRRRSVVGPPEE